jgi:hypothetical protein
MKKCPRCGKPVSMWQRDLFSGICHKCRTQEAAELERIRQQEEAARQRAIDAQIRAEQDRARQRREAALGEDLGQQLEKQRQLQSVSLPPCPDCGADLVEIKLFGRSGENPLSGAAIDTAVVYYAHVEARRGWAFGMLKEQGGVRATICTSCHRIFLHGVPLDSPW